MVNCKSSLHASPVNDSHGYHEFSDEEVGESPRFDLGPSLMDEVLRALAGNGAGSNGTGISGADGGRGAGGLSSTSSLLDRDSDWKFEFNISQPGS